MLQLKTRNNTDSRQRMIQAKLKVGRPGDKYEQEANRVADSVMRISESRSIRMQPIEEEEEELQMMIQRQPIEEDEKMVQPKLRMQPINEDEEVIQPIRNQENTSDLNSISSQLNSSKNGSKLPDSANRFMSNALGNDFSRVKIHTGSEAVQMNWQLGAKAFTHGSNIYFNTGQFSPETKKGKHLLAHELTHVIQQGASTKQLQNKQGIQRQPEESATGSTPEQSQVAGENDPGKTMLIVKKGPVTPIAKPSSGVPGNISSDELGLQRKEIGVPEIQRVIDPASIGAIVAVTAITYQVLKDLVNIQKGDITYTFDRMRGQKYPNNNKNWEKITDWKSTYWDIFLIHYSPIFNEWLVGMEVRLNWEYNGYGLSGIYFTKRDFWDKPFWGGNFTWIIQPLMATRKDVNGYPVAKVKIVVDANFTQTIGSDIPESKAWIIDGEGTGKVV